jgi:2-keto-4-pentenoate hydratase/2-oxohepta-3-ene-1,7-dioic acid hydratase in catechol pathway
MKLASFSRGGRPSFGIVADGGFVDLAARTGAPSLKSLLGEGVEALQRWATTAPDVAFEEAAWLPPIPDATHIIGIGLNTRSHFEETAALMKRTAGDYPKRPRLFTRSPFSQVAHGAPLMIPRASDCLDYEGEVAMVIGRPARYVPCARALEHVAGFACYNDGSVRDFQAHSTQVTAGKNFAASGAFGPWLVTADEVGDPAALTLETRVNGEARQRLTMDDLIFDFAELVAYISQIYPLQPGDVILTGSPAGIGAISRTWLRAGDRVEIDSPQLGLLSNPVAREADVAA